MPVSLAGRDSDEPHRSWQRPRSPILLLEERGYAVAVVHALESECWIARRDNLELTADDPIQLLGLAALAETRGPAWRPTDEQIAATLSRFGLEAPS